MDGRGTPLRTWEKLYWGVFVTAISLFLFNRLKPDPVDVKVRCWMLWNFESLTG